LRSSGRRGREFKSPHPDQLRPVSLRGRRVFPLVRHRYVKSMKPCARAVRIQHGCGSSAVSSLAGTSASCGACATSRGAPGPGRLPPRHHIAVVLATAPSHRGSCRRPVSGDGRAIRDRRAPAGLAGRPGARLSGRQGLKCARNGQAGFTAHGSSSSSLSSSSRSTYRVITVPPYPRMASSQRPI
jgi:hypothetical protein